MSDLPRLAALHRSRPEETRLTSPGELPGRLHADALCGGSVHLLAPITAQGRDHRLGPAAHGPLLHQPEQGVVALPSTACSTMASSSRSVRPLFWLSMSRNPSPFDEAISSAATRNSHDCARASRSPENTAGTTAGSCTVRSSRTAGEPERARRLDELPVDVAQRQRHGGEHREHRADRDQGQLGVLADLHPQDEQRHPRQRRTARSAPIVGPTIVSASRDRPTATRAAARSWPRCRSRRGTRCVEMGCAPAARHAARARARPARRRPAAAAAPG